ncbi:MAG: putative Ig domain-containing protein, partial [Clostridiales bacterium]|nr:putative Ig domain-containing protein [Clostridiales bacterium]
MKSGKKVLSLLMAVMMILTVSLGSGMAAYATEPQGEETEETVQSEAAQEEETEETVQAETAQEEETETPEEAATDGETTGEDAQEEAVPDEETADEADAAEVNGEAEPETEDAEQTEEPDAASEDAETETTVEIATEPATPIVEIEEDAEESILPTEDEAIDWDANISVTSLLPIVEVKAYLVLSDYSEDDLSAMDLDEVLTKLQDSDGNSISIPSSATTVWRYVKDDTDGVEMYEEYTIGNGETIDLSTEEGVSVYTTELIIGSNNQLDSSNIRYIVKVYVLSSVMEDIGFELYTQSEDGSRTEIVADRVDTIVNTQFGVDITVTLYTDSDHVTGKEYYLGISSTADEHPNIRADILSYAGYISYLNTGSIPVEDEYNLTDQILNQDMTQTDAGYLGTYDPSLSVYDTKNMFIIVYTNVKTGALIKFSGISFSITSDVSYIGVDVFAYDNGEMVDVFCREVASFEMTGGISIEIFSGSVTGDSVERLYYMLNEGYSADDEYYCVMNAHGTGYGDDANSYVTKAVVGLYDTLEDAADAEDIKDELIPVDQTASPRGYKANYNRENGGVYFTVFFEDGSVFQIWVCIMEYDPEYDENYVKSFTDAPIIGEADPWFRVTGAEQNGEALDTYIVENGGSINMDTMYGYGYQTVFINDADADLSALQPVFWTASADRIEVYVNGSKVVSGDTIDCSAGTVEFSVIIDGNVRNYMVNFVKKTSGAQLYVCGPETREVFLDEYFEYKHDILIANIGDEELTGLRVELNATNCKLDDYWTVGGEGNDTLAAFTSTSSSSTYGELSNLAKIRLLPDGDGEIEGTLTVYADGQEPIVINLTGVAQNPGIVTESVDDAVKYVPYSYLITTDNMYDWTEVNFTLTDGELPEGLELYATTGEIYGVAQESGEFTFTVEATFTSDTYSFESSSVELTLTVLENTNDNVYYATDDGYDIMTSVGVDESGTHDYILTEYEDEEFRSSGVLEEFIDLWLNGEKLEEGVDYVAESGSTKITILQQTFENKAVTDGVNTLAAEFRVDGDTSNTLKRTAQNFRLDLTTGSDDGDDDSGTGDTGTGDTGTGDTGTGDTGTGDTGTGATGTGAA